MEGLAFLGKAERYFVLCDLPHSSRFSKGGHDAACSDCVPRAWPQGLKARKSSPALTARLKACPSTNLRSRRHEPPYSKLRPLRGMGPWFPPLQRTQEWGTLSRGASPTRRRSGPSAPGNSVIPSSIDSHLSKITKRVPRPTSNRIEEFFRTAPLKPTPGLNGPPAKGCDSVRHNDRFDRGRMNSAIISAWTSLCVLDAGATEPVHQPDGVIWPASRPFCKKRATRSYSHSTFTVTSLLYKFPFESQACTVSKCVPGVAVTFDIIVGPPDSATTVLST